MRTLRTVCINIDENEEGKLGYTYPALELTPAEALVLISGLAAMTQDLVRGFAAFGEAASVSQGDAHVG